MLAGKVNMIVKILALLANRNAVEILPLKHSHSLGWKALQESGQCLCFCALSFLWEGYTGAFCLHCSRSGWWMDVGTVEETESRREATKSNCKTLTLVLSDTLLCYMVPVNSRVWSISKVWTLVQVACIHRLRSLFTIFLYLTPW